MNQTARLKTYRNLLAILAWFGLLLQLWIMIAQAPDNVMSRLYALARFLHFFTILSNLLVALALTAQWFKPLSHAGRFLGRPTVLGAIAVYIFVVGVVYNTVLRGIWDPQGWQWIADNLLHVVVPVGFVVYWLTAVPKGLLSRKHPFQWLIFPLAYLIYALVRGKLEDFYPYPFLDLNSLSPGDVFINCTAITILFIGIGFLFYGIDRRMNGKRVQTAQ